MSIARTLISYRRPSLRGGAVGLVLFVWGLCLVGLIVASPFPAWAGEELSLELRENYTGKTVLVVPIKRGEPFTVWFLHSYDRAFFAEHYQALGPGRIKLTHMSFKSNLNGGGFEYSDFHLRPDGVGELRNINKVINKVTFMQGSPDMADHTLILGGRRIRLVQYVEPGTLVDFMVAPHNPEHP